MQKPQVILKIVSQQAKLAKEKLRTATHAKHDLDQKICHLERLSLRLEQHIIGWMGFNLNDQEQIQRSFRSRKPHCDGQALRTMQLEKNRLELLRQQTIESQKSMQLVVQACEQEYRRLHAREQALEKLLALRHKRDRMKASRREQLELDESSIHRFHRKLGVSR